MRGRVVDEQHRPLPGLVVTPADRPEGVEAPTGADGGFELQGGGPCVVRDGLGLRALARGEGPDLVVPRAEADGFGATAGAASPVRRSDGNLVEFLADDEMHEAFAHAVRRARRTLHIAQLLFFPDYAPEGRAPQARSLIDDVVDTARRGAEVRILLNENAVIPDTSAALERHVRESGERIEVRRFPMSPNVMHAKLLLVDDEEAFVIGPPFEQKYWDTPAHRVDEPRRRSRIPVHDASLRVRGPLVADLHELFARLWNARDLQAHEGRDQVAPIPRPPQAGATTAQLVATMPAGVLPDAPRGEMTILESYLRAIAAARRYVYLESQYFTSRSIVRALDRALARRPGLEVILVVNETTDVPGYVTWQRRRVTELAHPGRERLGIFTLWRGRADRAAARPIYIHSKVAFVDDVWATIGTANLDSMSLETADEFGVPISANIDCNVVLFDDVDGASVTGEVEALRRRVWAEHLGDQGVWRPDASPLSTWRRAAEDNLERWRRGERLVGHAMPYLPAGGSPLTREREA